MNYEDWVQLNEKHPGHLAREKRKLIKLRQERQQQKDQGKEIVATKDDVRKRVKERETQRKSNSNKETNINKNNKKVSAARGNPRFRDFIPKPTENKPEPNQRIARRAGNPRLKREPKENTNLNQKRPYFPGNPRYRVSEGLAMKEIQRMDKKTTRKKDLASKLEKSQKVNATKPLSASPDVIQARKNRKAREANATPRLSASPDVQKARDKRIMSSQSRTAPKIGSKPADKAAEIVRNKTQTNNPAKTPDDNVAGAAERLKKKQNDDKSYKNVMRKIRQRKNNEKIAKIKAQRSDGFGSGLKSSLGGDIANRKTDAESIKKKKEARNKLGKSVGDFMKKAPGRVIGGALKTNTSNTGGTTNSQDLAGPKRDVYNG